MELTHEDVLEILATVEAADVDFFELEIDGTRIVVDQTDGQRHVPVSTAPVTNKHAGALAEAPVVSPVGAPSAPAPPPEVPTSVADEEGLVTVTAPMVGVYYRAPEPGAEPYVEVGSHVDADATVGLVEVMKMFNSVTAGTTGDVARILVANEEFVEFGQPLMLIRPRGQG